MVEKPKQVEVVKEVAVVQREDLRVLPLHIEATKMPKEEKPVVEKKTWNPLGLDMHAKKRGEERPKTKKVMRGMYHVSSRLFEKLLVEPKKKKIEAIVKVKEQEAFVEPMPLEVLKKEEVVEAMLEDVATAEVKAEEEVLEVISMESLTPTLER